MARSIADNWQEYSGLHHWDGLLDPLNDGVRQNILHYGDLVQAVGDGFNNEKASKNYGTCRYSMADLFDKVGLVKGNPFKYRVTKFVYATSKIWSFVTNTAWLGYIAVATDEGSVALGRRDIVVAWRGTILTSEWVNDVGAVLVPASEILGDAAEGDPKVHQGFLSIYTSSNLNSPYGTTSAQDQVLSEIRKLVDQYNDETISITVSGHSMGSALATLNAADIVANGYNKPTDNPDNPCLVTAFVTGCPRVGNNDFKLSFSAMENLRLLRVRNATDVVPKLPLYIPPLFDYVDVGVELLIDTSKSKELDTSVQNMQHNQPVYLYGVAGMQGSQEGFKLKVERDIALVNKDIAALKLEYGQKYRVPSSWWQVKNRGMVQSDDGKWYLDDDVKDNHDGMGV